MHTRHRGAGSLQGPLWPHWKQTLHLWAPMLVLGWDLKALFHLEARLHQQGDFLFTAWRTRMWGTGPSHPQREVEMSTHAAPFKP